MKKKNMLIAAIISAVVLLSSAYYFLIFAPHQEAVSRFETAKEKIVKINSDLENIIAEAETVINKKEEPLDQTTLTNLENSVTEAKKVLRIIPKIESSIEAIKSQTEELNKPLDYSIEKKNITDNIEKYQTSVTQLKQITNPSQSFIEERLKEIDTIAEIQSVTENNDPNGKLNKQGGYTASVYFSDNQVTESIEGADIVAKGTDAGGNIEVYATKEDAEKRNTYLSAFDGNGLLDPGSHYVYGTVVIRTSSHLTATQQNELTAKIYNKLIEIK